MLEINPVLAGTYDKADYAPASVNATAAIQAASNTNAVSDTSGTSSVDDRRYTKFDRSASQVADADFSFGDFLDMVNPLQHIPVVSSVYRAIAGDSINPVSRVAGDILYGGLVGVGSAVLGGAGAAMDSVVEAQTGKSASGYCIASIFGDDKMDKPANDASGTTQLASNAAITPIPATTPAADVPPASTQVADKPSADTPASSAVEQAVLASAAAYASPGTVPAAPQPATAQTQAPVPSQIAAAPVAAAAPKLASLAPGDAAATADADASKTGKAFPLDRAKMPYGGVMAPVGNIQQQNMIMALSQSSHAMRMGNTIYTGKLMNGPHPLPIAQQPAAATASTDAAAPATTATTTATYKPAAITQPSAAAIAAAMNSQISSPEKAIAASGNISVTSPVPSALTDNMLMMKALSQYKSIANGPGGSTGAKVDLTN